MFVQLEHRKWKGRRKKESDKRRGEYNTINTSREGFYTVFPLTSVQCHEVDVILILKMRKLRCICGRK